MEEARLPRAKGEGHTMDSRRSVLVVGLEVFGSALVELVAVGCIVVRH
mgnify:CR=1 FL=1